MKNTKVIVSIIILVLLIVTIFTGCSKENQKEITFADAGWESNKFHNAVAGLIQEVYGYNWREIPGNSGKQKEC